MKQEITKKRLRKKIVLTQFEVKILNRYELIKPSNHLYNFSDFDLQKRDMRGIAVFNVYYIFPSWWL